MIFIVLKIGNLVEYRGIINGLYNSGGIINGLYNSGGIINGLYNSGGIMNGLYNSGEKKGRMTKMALGFLRDVFCILFPVFRIYSKIECLD